MLQPHFKWLQDFHMFNLIYPMSNINILDHHFYFKTQRGRIKSQPINIEVSHYHLRLLLGSQEAPWWWPLKAPHGIFASLGRKIKAWVRGVGFLMFPLEWWEFKPGSDWVRGVKEWQSRAWHWLWGCTCRACCPSPRSVTPDEPGGTEGWVPKCAPSYPCSSGLREGQVHMGRESWFTWHQPPMQKLAFGQKPNWEWEVRASMTSSKAQ